MTDHSREARLAAAFVKLADTLTVDYDVLDVLDTLVRKSVDLLETDAGGLLIRDPSTGRLQSVVSTSDEVAVVETEQLLAGDGPGIDCATTGRPVSLGDIEADADRWPAFRESAVTNGYRSLQAFPLRLRGTIVGAMTLFRTTTGRLSDRNIAAGQALADVATIGILQERTLRDSAVVTYRLQRALDTRLVIEQAKGIIAQSAGVDVDRAFAMLRRYARDHRMRLGDVAAGVAGQTLVITASTPAEHS